MKSYLKCSENRLIAWVCGGVTQAVMPRLRGALHMPKRSGDLQATKYLKYSNMKKEFLILVAAVMFAAFGCGIRQTGSNADAAIVEVDESWFGKYSYVTPPFTSNSGFTLSYSYSLEIMPDSCVFTGIGIQLYFIVRCSVKETVPDVLTVSFHSLIDGGGFYFSKPDFLKLYRRDGKYYFNSPYIEYVDDNLNSISNIDIEVVRDGDNPQPAFVDDTTHSDFAGFDFDIEIEEYIASGIFLKGNIPFYDSNLNEIGVLEIDKIVPVDILVKSVEMYNIKGCDELCEKAYFLKVRYLNKEYIIFGQDIYRVRDEMKFDAISQNDEKLILFPIRNFKMGASDEDGLTGCSSYSLLLLQNETKNNYTLLQKTANREQWWDYLLDYAFLVHDEGGSEKIYKISIEQDILIIGIKAFYQEGGALYNLKVVLSSDLLENEITDMLRFEENELDKLEEIK